MEISVPASPSRLAGLRQAVRADLRGVSDEVADDVVLALSEAATNAVLHGSSGGQPIQVVVHVNDDWVEASVLDHGPQPPTGLPADSGELPAGGRAYGCWGGWWILFGTTPSGDQGRLRLPPKAARTAGPPGSRTCR